MFNWKKQNSELLWKYIKINFLVIFLPVTIASIVYCSVIQKNYEEKYLDNLRYYADERMWRLEMRASDFQSSAERISISYDITPHRLNSSDYSCITALWELKSYRLQSRNFDKFAICLNDSDIVYTEDGTVSKEIFTEITFQAGGDFTKEEFEQLLNSQAYFGGTLENQYVISGNRKYRIMTYPLGRTSEQRYGTLVGFYEDDEEELFLSTAESQEERISVVCTRDGRIIYVKMQDDITSEQEGTSAMTNALRKLLSDWKEKEDYCRLSLFGKEYVGKIAYSDVNGWYCIDLVENSAITRELFVMQMPMLLLIIVSLFLMIIFLSILLSVYNYMPIRKLYNLFGSREENDRTEKKKDELLFLNQYIRELLTEKQSMEEQLETGRHFSRMELIQKLLRGNIDPKLSRVSDLLEEMDIHLERQFMTVIMVKALDSQQKRFIREQKQDGFYLTENIYKDYDAFLACVDSEQEIIAFVEKLEAEAGLRIGIGNLYYDTESLKYSLMEATISVESSDARIVWYSENVEPEREDFLCRPLRAEEKLIQLLTQGETGQLPAVLNELYMELLQISQCTSDEVMLFLTNRIWGVLFEAAGDVKQNRVVQYLYYTNLENFIDRLKEFLVDELKYRQEKKNRQEDPRIRSILEFVDENYMCKDMSLAMLANEFHLSESYLSKVFKTAADKNFISYITEKRMHLAAKLLVQTEDPVSVIVQKVGYLDVVSFTKKFTRYYKVSPGNYRKQVNKNDL